jgi:hypothetical protein
MGGGGGKKGGGGSKTSTAPQPYSSGTPYDAYTGYT